MRKFDDNDMVVIVIVAFVLVTFMIVSCERHRIDVNASLKQETGVVGVPTP